MGLIQIVACGNTWGPARRLLSPEVVVIRLEMFLGLLSSVATLEDMLELPEIVV